MKRDTETVEYRASGPKIEEFVRRVFGALSLPDHDAQSIASLMTQADMTGASAHGIFWLPEYVTRIRNGGINIRPDIRIARETAATAVVDGDNAMGHLVMRFATEAAIKKAADAGIAWVGTFNSNHAGPARVYTQMTLAHHMIGLYGAVGNANLMPPWGGTELLLGTNPFSVAFPSTSGPPIVLDMATTMASKGKIKAAAQRGETIPEGWVVAPDGTPITDPTQANDGYLVPIGGPKGYGLSLVLGLLAGTLNGAAMGHSVINFNTDLRSPTNTGQFICAISIAALGSVEQIEREVSHLAEDIRHSPAMPGFERVRLPGEESFRKAQEYSRLGIPLSKSLVQDLDNVASQLSVSPLELLEAECDAMTCSLLSGAGTTIGG